jgi:hypothetical protein
LTIDNKLRLSTLSQLDGRTAAAKEARDLASAIERDTGGDPSAAQRLLIEQTACLGILCGDYARRYLAGDLRQEEIPGWQSAVNTYRRLGDTLGWQRVAKEVLDVRRYLLGEAEPMHHKAPHRDGEAE